MAYADYYPRAPQLPWSDNEGDRRFRKIVRICLIVSVVLGLILPFIPVPEIDRDQYDEIPPRLVQVIQDRQKPPPPPPPKPKPKEPKAEPKAKPKPKPKAKPKPKPKPKEDAARRRAMQAMAWADELEDLREFDAADVQSDLAKPAAAAAAPADNGILTARAGTASTGIDTGALGQPTGNTHLTDREAAAVASNIPSTRQRPANRGGRGASRTDEDIQLVFDKNKGAIDRIYNRALRKDPTLQGKIVFKITIAPSGRVTKISIVSSEMGNPALEKRLMSRIKLFNFGAKQVGTVTVTYPVVFLPS